MASGDTALNSPTVSGQESNGVGLAGSTIAGVLQLPFGERRVYTLNFSSAPVQLFPQPLVKLHLKSTESTGLDTVELSPGLVKSGLSGGS